MASYSQGKDGRWRVRYWLPKDPVTGKRKQKRHPQPFRTKRDAQLWFGQERRRLERLRGIAPAEMTLADYAETWLAAHAARVREATIYSYRRMLDHHILPELGTVLIDRLTAVRIEAWHAQLASGGLGAGSIHRIHGLLCQLLRHAHRRGLLDTNQAALCWPPAPERAATRRGWTAHECRRFLEACNDPEQLVFKLALLTGLRVGELIALEWSDLELKIGTLSVRRTQTRDNAGKWTVGPPKTPRSRRTLALPDALTLELREHRRRHVKARLAFPGWWEHDLTFCRDDGRPVNRTSLRRDLHALCQRAGVPLVSMHALRHSATNLLVAMNTHPRVIQARLGHESVTMSMNLYADTVDDADREVARNLDRSLLG